MLFYEKYRRVNKMNEYQIIFSRNLRKDPIAKAFNVNAINVNV